MEGMRKTELHGGGGCMMPLGGCAPEPPKRLFNSRFAFATRYKIGDFLDRTRANATNLPESQILKA